MRTANLSREAIRAWWLGRSRGKGFMESSTAEIVTLRNAAETLLAQHFGRPIRLRLEPLARSDKSAVLRGHLIGSPSDLPSTVFVKHHLPSEGPEWEGHDQQRLLNDWTACLLLNHVGGIPPLAPQLFGGDAGANVLVMEDLGPGTGPNTGDLLMGSDPDLAAQGLLEGCALLGRLHGATLGRADEYQAIRSSLGPSPSPRPLFKEPWSSARRTRSDDAEVERVVQDYHAQFARVGIAPQPRVEDEIAQVTALVEEEPGPYLAFCKGDQNMAGDFLRCGERLRLFDFDASGFRHALIEGMPGRMTWGCMMHIPDRLLPEMERVYQAELARWLPEAADDDRFHRAMADAGARWHVFHVVWRVSAALTADWQRGPSTARQQVLAWLDSFAGLSEEFGRWRALGRSAREMAERLRAIWPEVAPLPHYPAFAGQGQP